MSVNVYNSVYGSSTTILLSLSTWVMLGSVVLEHSYGLGISFSEYSISKLIDFIPHVSGAESTKPGENRYKNTTNTESNKTFFVVIVCAELCYSQLSMQCMQLRE